MIHISRPAIRATATKRCLVFLLAHIHVQICPGFSSQNIMKLMNWWIHVQRLSRFCSWTDCWRELRNRLWNGAKKILMNHSRFWISSAKKKTNIIHHVNVEKQKLHPVKFMQLLREELLVGPWVVDQLDPQAETKRELRNLELIPIEFGPQHRKNFLL